MGLTRKLRRLFISTEKRLGAFEYDYKMTSPISDNEIDLMQEIVDPSVVEEYKLSNGFKVNWWIDAKKGIGGAINLNPAQFLLKDEQSLADECDMDQEMDQEIRHFRILDNPTMNSEAGFFVLPNQKAGKTIHFRMAGDKWTDDLDLDFNGYLEMALASRIYFNWQLVLIDIKNGKESKEINDFKENIISIFPDFNWADFVNKYNNLRISNA